MVWSVIGSAVAESNSDDPASYALPSGYDTGDLLLLFARTNAHDVVTGPSGWTLLASETGTATTSRWVVYGLIATSGSEDAPGIDWGGASSKVGITFALRDSNGVMSLASIVGDPDWTYTGSPSAAIPYPACTVAEDNSIVFIFGCVTKNNNTTTASANALGGFTEAVEIQEGANPYGSVGVLEYVIQTTKADISAGSIGITGGALVNADGVIFYLKSTTGTKYLKALVNPTAAGATNVAGVVFTAPAVGTLAGAEIGEFTGATFEALTEGTGDDERAILKVAVTEFGGSSLTTSDTPAVYLKNATHQTGIFTASVIEE